MRIALVLIGIVAATVSSCGDKREDSAPSQARSGVSGPSDPDRPISMSEEERLVWEAVRRRFGSSECRTEQIVRGSSTTNEDPDGARRMATWLEQELKPPTYQLLEQRETGRPPKGRETVWDQGIVRRFQFEDDGFTFMVKTDTGRGHYFHGAYGPQDTLWARASGCTLLPIGVTILDTNFGADEKTADVTYTVRWRLNKFGAAINRSGLASVIVPTDPERRATLRRLDATGWRVESM